MAAAAAAVQASAGAAVGMRSLKKKGVTSSSIAEVEKTEGKVQGKGNGDGLASAEVRHADLRRNARRDVIASCPSSKLSSAYLWHRDVIDTSEPAPLPVSGEDAKQTRGPPEHAATPMNRHGGLNGLASVCLLLHFEVTSGFSPDSIQRSESRAATDTTAQTALALILSESR